MLRLWPRGAASAVGAARGGPPETEAEEPRKCRILKGLSHQYQDTRAAQEYDVETPGDNTTSFEWQHTFAGEVLQCRPLAAHAPHVFTSRSLEFRKAPAGDYGQLASLFHTDATRIVRVTQVHGRVVVTVAPGVDVADGVEADALVSTDPSRVISVRVADCVPVLIGDRRRRAVAAIHAGWKGTCAGIVGATVEVMIGLGATPDDLVAAIGPSIGPCCYQVDERVRHAFLAFTPDAAAWMTEDEATPARWKLDLWRANGDQLLAAGVPSSSIHVSGVCTAHHLDRCYSHRAEGAATGRMVGAIQLV